MLNKTSKAQMMNKTTNEIEELKRTLNASRSGDESIDDMEEQITELKEIQKIRVNEFEEFLHHCQEKFEEVMNGCQERGLKKLEE